MTAKLGEDRQPPCGANELRAMDFVHDLLATGKKLRVLTVVDAISRFSPVVDPRHACRGEDAVGTLKETRKRVGYPKTIRVDQGSSSFRAISICGLTRTT